MSSSSNTSIAKKARTKAEADFATWLMMAKLGGFDDLPSNAQSFLTNYRARLETMSEADSTALAVREVYSAYYVMHRVFPFCPGALAPMLGEVDLGAQRQVSFPCRLEADPRKIEGCGRAANTSLAVIQRIESALPAPH